MSESILLLNVAIIIRPSVNPSNWKTGGFLFLKSNCRIQYLCYPIKGKLKLVLGCGG